jgi:hypothetical protein
LTLFTINVLVLIFVATRFGIVASPTDKLPKETLVAYSEPILAVVMTLSPTVWLIKDPLVALILPAVSPTRAKLVKDNDPNVALDALIFVIKAFPVLELLTMAVPIDVVVMTVFPAVIIATDKKSTPMDPTVEVVIIKFWILPVLEYKEPILEVVELRFVIKAFEVLELVIMAVPVELVTILALDTVRPTRDKLLNASELNVAVVASRLFTVAPTAFNEPTLASVIFAVELDIPVATSDAILAPVATKFVVVTFVE